jgi:hypothetical protein
MSSVLLSLLRLHQLNNLRRWLQRAGIGRFLLVRLGEFQVVAPADRRPARSSQRRLRVHARRWSPLLVWRRGRSMCVQFSSCQRRATEVPLTATLKRPKGTLARAITRTRRGCSIPPGRRGARQRPEGRIRRRAGGWPVRRSATTSSCSADSTARRERTTISFGRQCETTK